MTLPKRWLITGGCGFIGGRLAHRLATSGVALCVLDNLQAGSAEALPDGYRWSRDIGAGWDKPRLISADVREPSALAGAAAGADVIVHLAANTGVAPSIEDPMADCETNVLGTLNALEAARSRNVGRFVFASSGAPLGEQDPPLNEQKVPRPVSPYGASKLAGEAYCSAFHGSFGVETVALRFGNVFGPGSAHKQSVVARFLRRALAGQPLEIYGDGKQTRDFIFVDDIVDAIVRAASVPNIGGEVFQIASSRERTVNEIAEAVAKVVRRHTAKPVEILHRAPLRGDVRRSYSDTSKAKRYLGFNPVIDFQDGLQATLDYLLEIASVGETAAYGNGCQATGK